MKVLIVYNILLWYPDNNLLFDPYIDASDEQLGSLISQKEKGSMQPIHS